LSKGKRGTLTFHTVDSLLERAIPEPNTGCWLWLGGIAGGTGYPTVRNGNGNVGAHRLMASLIYGPIPAGMDACHRCDVRACVNPQHLFLGSRGENLADMRRKGRANDPRGEKHPKAKLTEDDVRAIRAALAAGTSSCVLGQQYGVAKNSILSIKHRRNWKHLPQETT
jgi:hypothetical protein